MANIKKHLDNIKGALYGKDVRSSIHDGIDAINKEVENTTGRQVDLESTFDQLTINAGNSNAEIVDARVKADGTSYTKLGDRLDSVDSQLEHIANTRFSKKKYVAIGDSITAGFVDKPYATLVGEVMDMTVVNLGVSGSAITVVNDRTDSIYERRGDIPEDADIISIFGGTNDFGHNSAMGMSGSTSFYEFYGAFRMLIEWIQQNRPNATLFVMTPLHREDDQIENSNGYTLEDYVNVIRDVCEKYSVPVLDLFKMGELNPNIEKHKELFASDGLHPLQLIHTKLGMYKIPQFIRGL